MDARGGVTLCYRGHGVVPLPSIVVLSWAYCCPSPVDASESFWLGLAVRPSRWARYCMSSLGIRCAVIVSRLAFNVGACMCRVPLH